MHGEPEVKFPRKQIATTLALLLIALTVTIVTIVGRDTYGPDLRENSTMLAGLTSQDNFAWVSDHELLTWEMRSEHVRGIFGLVRLIDANTGKATVLRAHAGVTNLQGTIAGQLHYSPDGRFLLWQSAHGAARDPGAILYIDLVFGSQAKLLLPPTAVGISYWQEFVGWDGNQAFTFRLHRQETLETWRCKFGLLLFPKLTKLSSTPVGAAAGRSAAQPVPTYYASWDPKAAQTIHIVCTTTDVPAGGRASVYQLPSDTHVQSFGTSEGPGLVPIQYFDPRHPAIEKLIHKFAKGYVQHAYPIQRYAVCNSKQSTLKNIGYLPADAALTHLAVGTTHTVGICCAGKKLWFVYNNSIYTVPIGGR